MILLYIYSLHLRKKQNLRNKVGLLCCRSFAQENEAAPSVHPCAWLVDRGSIDRSIDRPCTHTPISYPPHHSSRLHIRGLATYLLSTLHNSFVHRNRPPFPAPSPAFPPPSRRARPPIPPSLPSTTTNRQTNENKTVPVNCACDSAGQAPCLSASSCYACAGRRR